MKDDVEKPIRLTQHAKQQLSYRGTTEEEVKDTIRTCKWEPAELNRMECRKNLRYDKNWNDKHYRTKQVQPIFVEEENEIVVVTVYTYYF